MSFSRRGAISLENLNLTLNNKNGKKGVLIIVAVVAILAIIYISISLGKGEWKFWKWFGTGDEPDPASEPEPGSEPEPSTPPTDDKFILNSTDMLQYIKNLDADGIEALKTEIQSEIDGYTLTGDTDKIPELEAYLESLNIASQILYSIETGNSENNDLDTQLQESINANATLAAENAASLAAATAAEAARDSAIADLEAEKNRVQALETQLQSAATAEYVNELIAQIDTLQSDDSAAARLNELTTQLENAQKAVSDLDEQLKKQEEIALSYKTSKELAVARQEAAEQALVLAEEVKQGLNKQMNLIAIERDAAVAGIDQNLRDLEEERKKKKELQDTIQAKQQKLLELEENNKEDSKKHAKLQEQIDSLNNDLNEAKNEIQIAKVSAEEAEEARQKAEEDAIEAFENMIETRGELESTKKQIEDLISAPELADKNCMFGVGEGKNVFLSENNVAMIRCGYAVQYGNTPMKCDDDDKELMCAYRPRNDNSLPLLSIGKSKNGSNCVENGGTAGIKHGYCMKPYSLTRKQYDALPANISGNQNAKWGVNRCQNTSEFPVCYDTINADMNIEGVADPNNSVTVQFPFGVDAECPLGSFYSCRPGYTIDVVGLAILNGNKLGFSLGGFPSDIATGDSEFMKNFAVVAQVRVGNKWITQIARPITDIEVPLVATASPPFISFNADLDNTKKNEISRAGKIKISYFITRKGSDGRFTRNDDNDQTNIQHIDNVRVMSL